MALCLAASLAPVASAAEPAPGTAEPAAVPVTPSPTVDRQPPAAEGRLLVRFEPGAGAITRRAARIAVSGERVREPGLSIVDGLELVRTSLPVAVAAARLRATSGVLYAEPDYEIRAAAGPNDPLLPLQWGFENSSDTDLDMNGAWAVTRGSPDVVVAVVDSGVQLDHEDLAGNLWSNPGEIAANGIDDDDNGYVDDVHGWDFVAGDNVPDDEDGHGTHVSGTIAAVGDNGVGVTGVAYGSRIMPLRVLGAAGVGYVSDAIRAIDYAWRNGARISNHSWGWSGGASQPLRDAIEAAGRHEHLVVAAAGNADRNVDELAFYPAAYDLPNVISVAASTVGDERAAFSDFGPLGVDVAAPGEDITSTFTGSGYESMSGTSMATPHVTGVAALVLSIHPGWTASEVRARILGTARPVTAFEAIIASGGVVNAAAAVAAVADRAPVVTITAPDTGASVLPGTPVAFRATAMDPEQGSVAGTLTWVSDRMGEIGTGPSFSRSDLAYGTHVITAIAHDQAGHRPLAAIRLRVGPVVTGVVDDGELRTPTITIAADGTPVVAWTQLGVGTFIAERSGGAWTRERVTTAYLDRWPELGAEPDGRIRLFLQRFWTSPEVFGDSGILAATGEHGDWSVQRVSEACGDDAEGCGHDWNPAWSRDPSGQAHVAWLRVPVSDKAPGNHPGLWHAVEHADGTWTSELVLASDAGEEPIELAAPDIATGPDGVVHIVVQRLDDGAEGIYDVSNETGGWVSTAVGTQAPGAGVWRPSVQVSPTGVVDVAWATPSGAFVRTRSGGIWADPVTVTTGSASDVDLARDGSSLHLVIGRTEANGTAAGMAYATSVGGGPWAVTEIDTGQDVYGRLAIDNNGRVHVSYLRAWPDAAIRHATNASGAWVTDTVAQGWQWAKPAYAVDGAGVRHMAVARFGTQPGLWYGTNAGGTWSLQRLTTNPVDGDVGLAVAPDGTAAIAYAEMFDAQLHPLTDPAVRVISGRPGAFTTTRIAGNTGTGTHPIARDAAGRLHLVFGYHSGINSDRLAYATNASGSWVVSFPTSGFPGVLERDPALAVDASGRVHIAYLAPLPDPGALTLYYLTNAGGTWASTRLTDPAGDGDIGPAIAVDPVTGRPRVAYWRSAAGAFLLTFNGSTWTSVQVGDRRYDAQPSVAVDGAGRTHVLYTGGGLDYAVCGVPLCEAAPGLRWWTDQSGFGAPRRVSDYGDDTQGTIVRGLDGSVAAGFVNQGWRLAEILIQRPIPTATPPVTHLAGAGTNLAQRKATVEARFTGAGAATYRLARSANGGGYSTVGSVTSSTTRALTLTPSTSTTQVLRVTPYAIGGLAGPTAYGAAFRVWSRSEAPSSTLIYTGRWSRSSAAAYFGGAVRWSRSASARATYRFTGREVAWISSKGPGRGRARVYLDGKYVRTISLAARSTHHRRIVLRLLAPSGPHTITIRPTGSGRVDLDGFLVLR